MSEEEVLVTLLSAERRRGGSEGVCTVCVQCVCVRGNMLYLLIATELVTDSVVTLASVQSGRGSDPVSQ